MINKSIISMCFLLFGLAMMGCSSNETEELVNQPISEVTWEEFQVQWANKIPFDELKGMEQLDLGDGIKIPNVQRYDYRISNYLFLGVEVDETTNEILYIVMLGKYHDEIFEHQVEAFKTMTSLLSPDIAEVVIKQLFLNLNLHPDWGLDPSVNFTRSDELYGLTYKSGVQDGIVQLEIKLEE